MKKILVFLKDYKKETFFAPLFKFLEASFELMVPIVMASLIDIGISNKDVSYIGKCCAILVSLGIIGLICAITAQYFAAKAATGMSTQMRHALFSKIQRFSFTDIDHLGTSTLITRMTSDVNQVQSGVNLVLRLFLRSPSIVFGAAVMSFVVDKKAAVVFAVVIPLLSVIVFSIMLVTMPLYRKVQEKLDRVLLMTRETLTGVRVLRAFNKEEEQKEEFRSDNQVLTDAQIFAGRISALMNPATYIVVNVGLIVLIYTGAVRVQYGALTQGQVVALVNYMSQILVELIKLANLIITVTKAMASGRRIQEILEVPEESEKESEIEIFDEKIPVVEFDHVSLTYKNAMQESLSDISFKAYKGQIIGIIGGTGSGKSSLMNLIPGFYPATKGHINVFGKDVTEWNAKELRSRMGIAFQKPVVFKGTIRDNLCWGKENATDGEIEAALEMSQAREFVEKKEQKLDTLIEQSGRNLSGGQKQRLTIARALVGNPDILLLDDSTSALDYATEAKFRQQFYAMKERPLIFLSSQRVATVRDADCILVMDDGKMVGRGTHGELLKTCDVYREIYLSQTSKEVAGNERI